MFVLRYLGSILKVEQPSEIVISDAGVKVTPLEESTLPVGYVPRPLPTGPRFPKQVDPQLEAKALALGEAVVAELPKRGKVKDPDSLWSRLESFLKENADMSQPAFYRAARAKFIDARPSTLQSYLSAIWHKNHPIV